MLCIISDVKACYQEFQSCRVTTSGARLKFVTCTPRALHLLRVYAAVVCGAVGGGGTTTSRERLINIFMSVFVYIITKDQLQVKELSFDRL